jgi:hypothetical protein
METTQNVTDGMSKEDLAHCATEYQRLRIADIASRYTGEDGKLDFRTTERVARFNQECGLYWFSKDTMRFFNSRVGGEVFHGRYFISSERCGWAVGARREYTVREVKPNGDIDRVGELGEFSSSAQAKRYILKHLTR